MKIKNYFRHDVKGNPIDVTIKPIIIINSITNNISVELVCYDEMGNETRKLEPSNFNISIDGEKLTRTILPSQEEVFNAQNLYQKELSEYEQAMITYGESLRIFNESLPAWEKYCIELGAYNDWLEYRKLLNDEQKANDKTVINKPIEILEPVCPVLPSKPTYNEPQPIVVEYDNKGMLIDFQKAIELISSEFIKSIYPKITTIEL